MLIKTGVKEDLEEVLQACDRLIETRERQTRKVIEDAVAPRGGKHLQDFREEGLHVVKMHGSIYWHLKEDETKIEKFHQPSQQNAEGEAVRQLLIFPTRFKDIYAKNYFPLYSSFTRTLGQARLLIVIGHSMRDEYLRAAIRERLREEDFRLIIVDKVVSKAAKELEESSSGKILRLKGKIEDFSHLLCRALSEDGATETAKYLETAQEALRRQRTAKVEVASKYPRYVEPGQSLDVRLETIADSYTWAAPMLRDGSWETLYRIKGKQDPIRDMVSKKSPSQSVFRKMLNAAKPIRSASLCSGRIQWAR